MPNKETNKWNKVMDKIVNKHKILTAFDIILKLLSDSYFFLF